MPRRLLVYLDTTQPDQALVLHEAVRLARATRAHLTVVDVLDVLPTYARLLLRQSEGVLTLARAEREGRLRDLTRGLRRSGVPYEVRLLDGTPAGAIVREVEAHGFELVALYPGSRLGYPRGTITPVAARIVRKCPADVLLVKTRLSRRRPRITCALDVSHPEPEATTFQLRVLDRALEVAALTGGTLQVLHAWTAMGEITLRGRGGLSGHAMEEYVTEVRAEAERAMARLLAHRPQMMPAQVVLEKGDPAFVLPQHCAQAATDLLVIGSVARAGLAGVVIGNTAEALVGSLPCSTLVVKPARADLGASPA